MISKKGRDCTLKTRRQSVESKGLTKEERGGWRGIFG